MSGIVQHILQICIVMLLKKYLHFNRYNAYTQFLSFVKICCVGSQVQKYLRIPRKRAKPHG